MPRFVVLHHECPADYARPTHWDLMLQSGGTLVTWALLRPPGDAQEIAAERLADHRLDFLNYQGPLTDGRGRVTRHDEGEYELREGRLEGATERLVIRFKGKRLRGLATLQPLPGEHLPGEHQWRFSLFSDRPEATSDSREG